MMRNYQSFLKQQNQEFNKNNNQDEKKEFKFKSNPFSFKKEPEPETETTKKSENNFSNFFNIPNLNEKKNEMNTDTNAIKPQKEKREWDGNFFYAEINEIHIPIPSFVQLTTIKQIFAVVEEAQKQVNDYLENPKLKNQFLEMIHKEFIKKNETFIDKYCKKPQESNQIKKEIFKVPDSPDNSSEKQQIQNHKRNESGNALDMHLKKQEIIYQNNNRTKKFEADRQSHNSQASRKSQFNQSLIQKYKIHNKNQLNSQDNDLEMFLVQSVNQNQKNCYQIYQDIQQQIKQKEEKQQVKNKRTTIKNPYLYSDDDYQINEEQLNLIIQTVDKFGVDRCQVQEKINSALKTETMTINFKENKLLKTITYSILYRSICQQELEGAKKFIYKILGYINPKSKGVESENFVLRQIFLQFLCILITDTNYQQQATTFLNTIFSFEFLSSLILDYMYNSAQKMLKLKNPEDDGINQQIEWLAKGYNLDLYLVDRNYNVKKYNHNQKNNLVTNIIFIYFEQNFSQQPNQAVYFVINPNDQLLAFM